MASLTEQLDALIAEHGLSSITLTRLAGSGRTFWSINAQGYTPSGAIKIGSADYGTADVSAAVAEAITDLNAKRATPVVVADLAPMLVAA